MNRGSTPADLDARLAGQVLARGPVLGPFDGLTVEIWLHDGEPAVTALAGGDPDDLVGLHRIAWSLGSPVALGERRGQAVLIDTAGPPSGDTAPRATSDTRIDAMPAPVPGVVGALVRLADTWRGRGLGQCLAGHRDWTETGLNLAVEAPIAGVLLGAPGGAAGTGRMEAELALAGVVAAAVPPGLLALAWDLHLARGVRLAGADASIVQRPPVDRAGPDRAVLHRFAAWAGTESGDASRVLVPACGSGRLLVACGDWATANGIHLSAIDPDPRAVLFATALLERDFGHRIDCQVRVAHPLVETGIFDDPLARLIPQDARERLRPADWSYLFGGAAFFDRVLIGAPAVPLTRRTAVQRYVEGRYAAAGSGTNPALLLVEAGARRLSPGGRVLALFRTSAYRAPSASAFRRWLAPRAEELVAAPGYCAVLAAADPVTTMIRAGRFGENEVVLRPYPRSALDPASWTVTDPGRAILIGRLEAGAAPLGEILLGGVRAPAPPALDPRLVIDAGTRRRLIRADRRAGRAIRPLIAPGDVTRFGSARWASRWVIAGPLPDRAERLSRELGLEAHGSDPFPPPGGPRLLFAERAGVPAFLCDPAGAAIPDGCVGTIAPGSAFLAGLLHSAPVAVLIAERCPGGITARCLSRLPVRLPDQFQERECRLGDEIAALARERISLSGREGPDEEARRKNLEARIDQAVEGLHQTPSC